MLMKSGICNFISLALVAGSLYSVHLLANAVNDANKESVAEDVKRDLKVLSPYAATGAKVQRKPRERCNGFKPFKLMACGPMTTIHLELMPGMYGSFEHTTTQGGDFAQWMSMLGAMNEATGGNTLLDMANQVDSQDGSSISIALPLIDYGFSGSFGNASIVMNRAHRNTHGGVYEAIGPMDTLPGPGFEFPLSGKVTIDEYTPTILRGGFSGGMVDLTRANLESDDPLLPIHKQLSGTFNIIAPWRGDKRTQVGFSEDPQKAVMEDIGQYFPGSLHGQSMGKRGDSRSSPPSGGTSSGGGGSCDCSCNRVNIASSHCLDVCEGTFEACKGIPVPGIAPSVLAEAQAVKGLVANAEIELRKKFISQIASLYSKKSKYQEILSGYLESFDGMTSFDNKSTLYVGLGGKAECPPPENLKSSLKMTTLMFCR